MNYYRYINYVYIITVHGSEFDDADRKVGTTRYHYIIITVIMYTVQGDSASKLTPTVSLDNGICSNSDFWNS